MTTKRLLYALCIIQSITHIHGLSLEIPSTTISYLEEKRGDKYLKGTTLHTVSFRVPQEQGAHETLERKGVIAKRPGALATILVCHGYTCNKEDTALFRLIFPRYNVMTFDFRAHGEGINDRHYCTLGRDEMYDVLAAANVIKADPDLNKVPLIVYGFSMGAVASIQAQAADSNLFQGMILDCPFDKSENVIKRALNDSTFTIGGYSFHIPGRSFLEEYAFHPYVQGFLKFLLSKTTNMDASKIQTFVHPVSPEDSMKKITVPCLVIHCRNDEKVPVEAVKRVYDGAQGFKRLWITHGRRHFDSFFYNPEKYAYTINKFVETVIHKKFVDKVQAKIKEDPVKA